MHIRDFVELCNSGEPAKIKEAIINGIYIPNNIQHMTALMWAARNGYTEIAELLIKHGAKIEAKDRDNGTALMWAALRGKTETVELLLRYGADTTPEDKHSGWCLTALMWAEIKGRTETAQLLRSYGAK